MNATQPPEPPLLSTKAIPVRERLIFAMDVPTVAEAKALVEQLGDAVVFYKLGLEIFMAGGYYELISWLRERNKEVFVDLKFFDVPQTVQSAVAQLTRHDVRFVTVHGNDAILAAAVKHKNNLKILAVTALTSLDQADLQDLGFACDVQTLVLSRAKRALALGCDGVISSGLEARPLRASLGRNFLVITPGIRPVANTSDDQKRKVDIEDAFLNGADYIVVGRPIKQAPAPRAKAEEIQKRIAALFKVNALKT
ncbi:MAG TPA: orotidine-5'-phosphate decarboxylase [Candidatus Saccharimonadales bacterium]|nr:orotidine-5'-phosphate decarboxylase [Candidatus Saccharimonadales bacterium]